MSSMQNRRSSSTMAKRNVIRSTSENSIVGKVGASKSSGNVTKKRPPLSNLTNQKVSGSRSLAPSSTLVPCSNKIARSKKSTSTTTIHNSIAPAKNPSSGLSNSRPTVDATKPVVLVSDPNIPRSKIDNAASRSATHHVPRSMDISPSRSDGLSVSIDESISTCDSFRSPDVEYVDNNDVNAATSLERKTFSNLCISEHDPSKGNVCSRDVSVDMDVDKEVVCVDENTTDPQLCATYACDIYHHLRASEAKKRPSVDFMERVQKDINASMRSILIDWLVEVAEEYRLVPDTLYLTVNYIDRYLSGNTMNRQRLQLLGVACMMIASKYEEICAPQVEEFCYITDNTYFKEEVLEMESSVLNYLKFEMTAPTAKCFLRRFVRAAQGADEVTSLHLECMANYVAELSLLEYSMLCYAPSLIAASSIFLANYILLSSKRPWTSTLRHYTLYKPSDLQECVLALHQLCRDTHHSNLPAIREKYSQHKYKFVAKKYCPPSIPPEFFHNH